MFRLLALLGATMFVTLLVAGQDHGQRREGLRDVVAAASAPVTAPAPAPAKRVALRAPEASVGDKPLLVSQPAPQSAAAPAPVLVLAPAPPPAPEPEPEPLAVVYVRSNAINVREGPGTSNPVVGRLTRGEAVAVIAPESDGWLRIRIEGDGIEGYVAARLMSDSAP